MRIRAIASAAAVLCIAGCCYYAPSVAVKPGPGAGREPLVRVRLATGNSVTVSSSQGLTLGAGTFRQPVGANQPAQVSYDKGVVVGLGGRTLRRDIDTLAVTAGPQGIIKVGDRSYRGSLLCYRSADGDLAVVNVIRLDEYLFGVVPCEIGPINAATIEAAKAQAVAARSFTMTRLSRRKGLGHDLFDSFLRDQEYRGTERETELARQAVVATRGEVLEFHGEVCEALYHGNCGGVTANGSQPYLRSVPDTPGHRRGRKAYCSDQPNFSWQVKVPKESLNAVVSRLSGQSRAHVRSFTLDVDRQSGRVKYLHFATNRGNVRVQGSDFRAGMGLKSQNFVMGFPGSTVSFTGKGWGHGSGMCQDGAVRMAESGSGYRDILLHYYSGVGLKKLY